MRTAIAIVSCLFLLAACGGDDGAANVQKIKTLKEKYKALNAELAENSPEWQKIKNAVIPARSTWLRAKGSEGEAAAKQAFEEAQSAANGVIQLEEDLKRRIRELKDEIRHLGGKL